MAENSKIQLHLLEPRATEKTYGEQTKRVYVFPVRRSMSKPAIAEMIEKEFNVTVTDVKTLVRKGRVMRYSRGKRAYPGTTHRRDEKYAYVRLAEGDFIKVFDDEPNAETSAQEASAANKAAAKAAIRAELASEKEAEKAEKAKAEKTEEVGKVEKAAKTKQDAAATGAGKNAGKEKK